MRKKRIVRNCRIVYYAEKPSADFWTNHWKGSIRRETYRDALRGKVGTILSSFVGFLPRQGTILEAGCGTGHWVAALRARGYDCTGIDFSAETIEKVRELFPDLPVITGDVRSIESPDGYYAGYNSLGVMEHFEEGPEQVIHEARRVLKAGGTAVFSVPYFNPLRKFGMRNAGLAVPVDGREGVLRFSQYAFTKRELSHIFENCGFRVIAVKYYDTWKCLKDEMQIFRRIGSMGTAGTLLGKAVNCLPGAGRFAGHIICIICRKINV